MAKIAVIETGYVGLFRDSYASMLLMHHVSDKWVGGIIGLGVVTQRLMSKIALEVRNLFGRNAWQEVGFMHKGVGR